MCELQGGGELFGLVGWGTSGAVEACYAGRGVSVFGSMRASLVYGVALSTKDDRPILNYKPWVFRLLAKDDSLFRVDVSVVGCDDLDITNTESVLNQEGLTLLKVVAKDPGAYVFKTFYSGPEDIAGRLVTLRRQLQKVILGRDRILVYWTDVTTLVTDLDTEWRTLY